MGALGGELRGEAVCMGGLGGSGRVCFACTSSGSSAASGGGRCCSYDGALTGGGCARVSCSIRLSTDARLGSIAGQLCDSPAGMPDWIGGIALRAGPGESASNGETNSNMDLGGEGEVICWGSEGPWMSWGLTVSGS
jgi:hypothetical protein